MCLQNPAEYIWWLPFIVVPICWFVTLIAVARDCYPSCLHQRLRRHTTTDIWVAQLHPSQTLTTVRAMVLFYLQYTTINKTRIL